MGGAARDLRRRRRPPDPAQSRGRGGHAALHPRAPPAHGDNCSEPFTGFALDARRSISKFILFDVAERTRAAPLRLQPGRHYFELFVKASNARQPKLERSFEHVLEQKHLEDYRDDLAVYLIDYQITLPGVRRALAESEWLPQAAPARSSAH